MSESHDAGSTRPAEDRERRMLLFLPTEIRHRFEAVGLDLDELLSRCSFEPDASGYLDLAVSGGQDSLAMVILALGQNTRIRAHHVDHGLRDGSAEECFVLARMLKPLEVEVVSHTVAVGAGPNLEERARDARFALLPPSVATGHTADDQAETLLINLLRGSSSTGLAAMRRGGRHPILGIRRFETALICRAMGLQPIVDTSNDDLGILRNRIRHELLPLMDKIARRDVVPILERTSRVMREESSFIEVAVEGFRPVGLEELRCAHPVILTNFLRNEILRSSGIALSTAHTERCVGVVMGKAPKVSLPKGLLLERRRGMVRLLDGVGGAVLWELPAKLRE